MFRNIKINIPAVFLTASCVLGFAAMFFLVSGGAEFIVEASLTRPGGIRQWGTAACADNGDCDGQSTCVDRVCVPSLCGDGLAGNNEQCELPSVQSTAKASCPGQARCDACRCVAVRSPAPSSAKAPSVSSYSSAHPAAASSATSSSAKAAKPAKGAKAASSSLSSAREWEEAPSLPRETSDAAALAFHDALWVIGGSAGEGSAAGTVYFTKDGRTWETTGALPMRLSLHAAAAYQDRIWAIGGRDQWGKASALVFTSGDGIHWTQAAPLPRALFGHRAVVFGGRILAIGGQDAQGKASRAAYAYDAITERWTEEAELPRAFAQGMAEVFQGRLWILGGVPASSAAYSTADGVEWRKEGALPVLPFLAASAVHEGRLWMLGGEGGATPLRQSFSTGDGQAWRDEGLLPQKLKRHAAVSWKGRLWLLGGGAAPGRRVYVTPPLSADTRGNVGYDEVRAAQERMRAWGDRAALSATPDGNTVLYGGTENGVVTALYRLDIARLKRDALPAPSLEYGAFGQPTVTADGTYVAVREYQWFCRTACGGKLWLIDIARDSRTLVAPVPPVGVTGTEDAVSRNGLRVVFRARPESMRGRPVRRSANAAGSELFVWYRHTGETVQIPVAGGSALNPRFADDEGRFVTYALPDGGVRLSDIETGRDRVVPLPIGMNAGSVQALIQQMVEEMAGDSRTIRPQPNPAASSRGPQPGIPFTTTPPGLFDVGTSGSPWSGE